MMKWFGVKTVYKITVSGKARKPIPKTYDPSLMIEERVVLFKARSFDQAIKKAEKEAKVYASNPHNNPYGQIVHYNYLETADAYELFDPPGDGIEVYSQTEISMKVMNDNEILNRKFGGSYSESKEKRIRLKFLDGGFSALPD
jgi:hypothetical protein